MLSTARTGRYPKGRGGIMAKKEYELIGGKLIPTTMTIKRFDLKQYHKQATIQIYGPGLCNCGCGRRVDGENND